VPLPIVKLLAFYFPGGAAVGCRERHRTGGKALGAAGGRSGGGGRRPWSWGGWRRLAGAGCGDGAAGLELRDRAATGVRAWSQASAGGAFGIGMATRLLRPRLVREAGWDEKIEFRVWRTPAVLFLTSLRDEKINFAECR